MKRKSVYIAAVPLLVAAAALTTWVSFRLAPQPPAAEPADLAATIEQIAPSFPRAEQSWAQWSAVFGHHGLAGELWKNAPYEPESRQFLRHPDFSDPACRDYIESRWEALAPIRPRLEELALLTRLGTPNPALQPRARTDQLAFTRMVHFYRLKAQMLQHDGEDVADLLYVPLRLSFLLMRDSRSLGDFGTGEMGLFLLWEHFSGVISAHPRILGFMVREWHETWPEHLARGLRVSLVLHRGDVQREGWEFWFKNQYTYLFDRNLAPFGHHPTDPWYLNPSRPLARWEAQILYACFYDEERTFQTAADLIDGYEHDFLGLDRQSALLRFAGLASREKSLLPADLSNRAGWGLLRHSALGLFASDRFWDYRLSRDESIRAAL